MRYRRSRARREFEAQVSLTLTEIGHFYGRRVAPSSSKSRLLAVYYVFAFAQLEVFVKTLVEDSIQALFGNHPTLDKMPELMVGYMLHRGEDLGSDYRKFAINEDEGGLLERLAGSTKKFIAWSKGGPAIITDSSIFLEKKKYPSPRNMPQLFRRLGIRNIWATIGAAGRFNAELTLTSLNDLRTAIAHDGEVPSGFGMSDFRDRLMTMKKFVAAMDRGVAAHFCGGPMKRSTWNRAIS